MKTQLCIAFLLVFCGCTHSNEYEKEAWNVASQSPTNRLELTDFLSHYKRLGNKDKYSAACFLVKNMPTKYGITPNGRHSYDIDNVKADSLKASLEYSFLLREKSPFLKEYTLEQFYEYVLPHRIWNEPLEYYWKWDLANRFARIGASGIIETAKAVNSQIRLDITPASYGDLPRSYSQMKQNGWGKCDDRAKLVVMALRAVGIPAAYEFVPYWGSSNNGHSFATVILPNGDIYPLPNTNETGVNEYISRKVPKIYRQTYAIQAQGGKGGNAPDLFARKDIMDVTHLHHVGHRDIYIEKYDTSNDSPIYLSVFSPKGWIPIAESTTPEFKNAGTGIHADSCITTEAKDLGNGILYLPTLWENEQPQPIGSPLIVSEQVISKIEINSSSTETIVLRRKYPLSNRIIDYANLMVFGVFEGANHSDFSDAETLYSITDTPESKMQYVEINADKPYRYIRYKRSKGTFSISELAIKGKDGKNLTFQPIACDALDGEDIKYIFDSDPLTYFQTAGDLELWVGCNLKCPTLITSIGFAPRNDDNAIAPLNTYELFYWNDQWVSLGKQTAKADSLTYTHVPKGALLWLHNLTRGKEERPFTYQGGKQIWW